MVNNKYWLFKQRINHLIKKKEKKVINCCKQLAIDCKLMNSVSIGKIDSNSFRFYCVIGVVGSG